MPEIMKVSKINGLLIANKLTTNKVEAVTTGHWVIHILATRSIMKSTQEYSFFWKSKITFKDFMFLKVLLAEQVQD